MNALTALAGMSLEELVELLSSAVAAKLETPEKVDEPLTAKVVAKKLGISVPTLYRRVDRGEFPAPAYGGRKNGSTGVWLESQLKS